jgi:hypothetical protein
MTEVDTKQFEVGEFAKSLVDSAGPEFNITGGEKKYLARGDVEQPGEACKIIVGRGIFLADADTIRIYPGGKVKRSPEAESPKENTRALEAEVKWLRELLNDKSCGVGLMRVSLVCSVAFFLFFLIGAYTPLVLMHLVVSILGLIGSLGFFCIGWINSKP